MTAQATHHRINEQLEQYWNELRGARAMPLETEVNVDALKEIWEHCFLVSVHVDKFAYSYLGEQLIEAYGDDYTGREIAIALLEPHPESLYNAFEKVRISEKPHVDENEFTNSQGRIIKYRSCILPLAARGHDGVAYLLGGMKWKAC